MSLSSMKRKTPVRCYVSFNTIEPSGQRVRKQVTVTAKNHNRALRSVELHMQKQGVSEYSIRFDKLSVEAPKPAIAGLLPAPSKQT